MMYRIETKSGKIYKAKGVEISLGFLIATFYKGNELKIPAGEVLKVTRAGGQSNKYIAYLCGAMLIIYFISSYLPVESNFLNHFVEKLGLSQ